MNKAAVRILVEAVELCGPGLPDWNTSRLVLAGTEAYRSAPVVLQPPPFLSPAERRRAVPSVKLALSVGAGAAGRSGHDPRSLPAVFASSGADGETINAILLALTMPDREVSPTRFHNSVHNAPSGYWGIAMQSQAAVTSLSAHDASFAAGLLEASVQAASGGHPVLLVAYDLPYPEPLHSARRIEASFGVALVLRASSMGHDLPLADISSHAVADPDMARHRCAGPAVPDQERADQEDSRRGFADLQISLAATSSSGATCCTDQGLEGLRLGNPAARCLPLLALLAARRAGTVRLDFNMGALDIAVSPC